MTSATLLAGAGRLLRALAGLVLLVAVVAKLLSWQGRATYAVGPWIFPDYAAALLVSWEALLGSALLVMPGLAIVRFAALATFSGFAGVLLSVAWVSGDCGCFGVWSPPAWATLAFDLVVVAGLLACPRESCAAPRFWWLLVVLPAGAAAALAFVCTAGGSRLTPPTTSGAIVQAPAIPRMPEALLHGRWLVCAYRDTCGHCQGGAMGTWVSIAQAPRADGWRWALLNLDPAGRRSLLEGLDTGAARRFRLVDPWVETPQFYRLVDGRIEARGREPSAILPP